jgi:hypothetical protein
VEGFHSGRKGIGDEDCSGCPTTSYMADSVEGIDTFVQEETQCSTSSKNEFFSIKLSSQKMLQLLAYCPWLFLS